MRYTTPARICLLVVLWPTICLAQSDDFPHVEVGVLVGWIDLNTIVGEKPIALGLRGGYRVNTAFGVEGEWIKCPENGVGNFGQQLLLVGIKAGPHFGPLSVLGRVRVGALRLSNSAFTAYNGGRPRTEPAIDVGAVIELRMSPLVAIRIDGGRTIVPFGSEPVGGPLPPHSRQLGTTVNPQGAFGLQFSF